MKLATLLLASLSTASSLLAPPASAQSAPATAQAEASAHPHRVVSVTVSPLHLFMPIVEVTAEVRASDKLGLALVLGGGSVKTDGTAASPGIKASAYEAGAQLRYYAAGDFRHGLQLGVEAMYIHVALDADEQDISAQASGLAVGPFIGYKYTTDFGFTFDSQLGVQRLGIAGKAGDGSSSAESKHSAWAALLNLNVGWSF